MARKIVWTQQGHNQKIKILAYWLDHNQSSTYSKKLNHLFNKKIELLIQYPYLGIKTQLKNIRVKTVNKYLIAYKITEREIQILAVWDSRQNPEDFYRRLKL